MTLEIAEDAVTSYRLEDLVVRFLPPPGHAPIDVPLQRTDLDTAEARMTLPFPGDYLPVLVGPDGPILEAPPISLPYSPEFLPAGDLDGEAVLADLAHQTGGRELGAVEELFEPAASRHARRDLTPILAVAAMILLVLEVAERRLSLSVGIRQRVGRGRSSG